MVEIHASQEFATSHVVKRVEQRIGSFLHSRLPGPKTEKAMKFYDAISERLTPFSQEAAQKLRPIVKPERIRAIVWGHTMKPCWWQALSAGWCF